MLAELTSLRMDGIASTKFMSVEESQLTIFCLLREMHVYVQVLGDIPAMNRQRW
jgi:hypothetical protein